MKRRLILIVLALVVLPTALLSFMANRALRSREDLLQYRLKMDAANGIQVVSRRLQTRLEDDVEHVRAVISECLARGGKSVDIEATAGRLRHSRGTISQVYLFMNPWGFVYPETARQDDKGHRIEAAPVKAKAGAERSYDSILAALRREVVLPGARTNLIFFTVDDASYCFAGLLDRKDMYAGFEINQNAFSSELADALAAGSGEVFVLSAEGPGVAVTNEIVVDDVFGERTEVRGRRPDLAQEPVAGGRLLKPFDYVSIKAYVVDPGRIKKAAELRYRLFTWGIILMAAGVCVGLLLVLREAASEIRRAKSRSEFVIGVSHDLRTPVASMRMLAESLYLDHVESIDQQKKFLRVIVRESERLGQLIERVLFFVRMDQDALVYRFKQVDIGKLAAVTVEAFKTKAAIVDQKVEMRVHHVSIGAAIEPGLPVIHADDSALTQVILNLIDNAIKYSKKDMDVSGPEGSAGGRKQESWDLRGDAQKEKPISRIPLPDSVTGGNVGVPAYRTGVDFTKWARAERRGTAALPSVNVEVSTVVESLRHRAFLPERRWVRISVKDQGIGIEKKELRKIFRRFYRVPGTGNSNISGVGLGLALCRHVAEAHGGWIDVESEIGKGSTFSVFLPVDEG